MIEVALRFEISGEDQASAGSAATSLMDMALEIDGVVDAFREKGAGETMDLGTIVSIIATSGATLAVAKGLARWLSARRAVTLTFESSTEGRNLKLALQNLDPETALRIVERAT